MNAGHKVPDLTPSARIQRMVQYYRDIRSHTGYIETFITMHVLEGWQKHSGVVLERWERECIFLMDQANRESYADVVKYHSDWDAAKAKAKNKG